MDRPQGDEEPVKEKISVKSSGELGDMHDLRRMALLQKLARDHGRRKAAAILGVDRRTLDAGLDEGGLSRRMRGALDRALRASEDEQRDHDDEMEARVKDMAVRVEALGKDMSRGFEAVRRDVAALRGDLGGVDRRVTQLESGRPGEGARGDADASSASGKPGGRASVRREFPELVTLEPAEDDEEVYGDAWPLIVEWRDMKATHPDEGKSLSWLRTEERFLTVELSLLEDHGMTLPPETYPLHGFDRNAQTNWRRTALYDTRVAIRKREMLRWARRACTLGLWWK